MSESLIRILFAGTPEFAVPSLQKLCSDNAFDIVGVITQPDKPVGRSQTPTPPPVKTEAEKQGITVFQPSNINKDFPDVEHDFLVVVAYGQILKKHILDAPNIAPVNLHASLLPRWRGASPMQSSILAGDTETGITIQRMVETLDEGPILSQKRIPLTADTTIQQVHDDLSTLGATLLAETLLHPLTETQQSEDGATYCKKLTRKIGDIDAAQITTQEFLQHVRALVPWPGVRCTIDGVHVKVIETAESEQRESVALACKDGTVHVTKLIEPGKKPMSGAEWMRGRKI